MRTKEALQMPQREVEALIGGAVLKTAGKVSRNMAVKKSKLLPKEIHLPRCGYTMHYLEREAVTIEGTDEKNQPTLLFCHGVTGKREDFLGMVADWDIPQHVRILVPEQIGHGQDVERARADPENFEQPTHESMLESTSEFLDEVNAGNNCNIFGISLGGAVAYYLHNERPDKIKRAVLVSPAILACIDKTFFNGVIDGTNNFCCFESREDVKLLMRDLSTGRNDTQRKKKDPIPKFFYESIYRLSKNASPAGHFMALLLSLLTNAGLTHSGNMGHSRTSITEGNTYVDKQHANPFSAEIDIDGESHRLVMWPNKDQLINYEQGKSYFKDSTTRNTQFETIPDCGHVFHSDGTSILKLIRSRAREYLLDFSSPASSP